VDTIQLNAWLQRWRGGDSTGADSLLRSVYPRLEALARKMLRGFPGVRRFGDTADVLQNCAIRLMRSLQQLEPPPATTREFFGLAAAEIRRELLDLARTAASAKRRGEVLMADGADPSDRQDAGELERWSAFHEAVEGLPADEREVVGLVFYHGWTQPQVAALFAVSERTVNRRWLSALVKLGAALGGLLPEA
jgi:RNA polymerase sigma factor (sigma-70 family)